MLDIENTQLRFVSSVNDVNEFFQWLGERREWLAFDTETGGLEFYKQPLRLVQIGDVDTGWAFRADRWLGVVEEALTKYTGRIVGQNVGFDHRFLDQQGGIKLSWKNLYDTKVMAHAIDPTKSTSLKALGARFLSPKAKKLQNALHAAMVSQKWGWADIPYDFEIYWSYACLDTILTARVADYFWPKIVEEYRRVFDLEMEVSRICSDMEVRGIEIDLPYVERKYEEIIEYTAQLETWCQTNYGIRPSEVQKVAKKLIDLGVDLSKTTATGQWAVDRDVLEGIDHPLAKAVLEHRQKTKIGSTYFKNFLEMHDNGVLHPSINTLGARTGRMTITNPAAQTLPRGRVVRDAFIPRHGKTWMSVDYDQIEMRLLAHFCEDQGLIDALNSGDLHTETARQVFGDPNLDKKDPRRSLAKNAGFAKIYGAGIEKFAMTAGVDVDTAKIFLDQYDQTFPGIKNFMKKVERVGKHRADTLKRAYVKSPLGRIHFSEGDKLYTLVNSLIQGTAADAFKQSIIDLDNSGFGQYLLLPVHDEINLEIPIENFDDLTHEIEKIMTQSQWKVPLTVSSGSGSCWGEAK